MGIGDSCDSVEVSLDNRCKFAIVDLNVFFKCGHPSEKALEDFDSNLWRVASYVFKNCSKLYCSKKQKKNLWKFVDANTHHYEPFRPLLRCIECESGEDGSGRHGAEYREIASCIKRAINESRALLLICLVDGGAFSLGNLCQIARDAGSLGLLCKVVRGLNDKVKIYNICINCINTSCGDSAECCVSP